MAGTTIRDVMRRLRHGRGARIAGLVLAGLLLLLSPLSAWPVAAFLVSAMLLGLLFAAGDERDQGSGGASARQQADLSSEARLHAILDAISSPTILIDARGAVIHANLAARQAFPGLRGGQPLAFTWRAPEMLVAIETVLGGAMEAAATLIERVPVERRYEIAIRRLAGSAEAPAAGRAFAVVIAPETSAAHRLEAMRADFIANASHELRTPLASIIGFIETLQGPARDDAGARRSFLAIMETQARRMARLIDDLLSLSRIEMSEHIRPSEPVDLGLVLRSVCDALGGLAKDRAVELRLALPEAPAIVTGDRDELVRVFENLIENATKYGQSGGVVDIAIAPAREAGEAAFAISVRDYGPGIAPEHLPRLTERFYRADVNESRVMGGTGLGLAIVKHIVTRHRGKMRIESSPGQGAVFTIFLPAENKSS